MTCPFLVTSSQQQENCHVTLRISRFMVRHQCVQVFKTLLRIKIDRNRYLSTVYTWVYKTITFLSFACPLPPPAPAVAVCPHDGAPDDCTCWWWHVRDDEGVLSWQCGYKWNIAIFLHSCPALSPRTMKVGPSSRTHTRASNEGPHEVLQSRRRPLLGPSPGWKSFVVVFFSNLNQLWKSFATVSIVASKLIPSVQMVTLGKGVSLTCLFVSWIEN